MDIDTKNNINYNFKIQKQNNIIKKAIFEMWTMDNLSNRGGSFRFLIMFDRKDVHPTLLARYFFTKGGSINLFDNRTLLKRINEVMNSIIPSINDYQKKAILERITFELKRKDFKDNSIYHYNTISKELVYDEIK